jgi:hypothetical protein
MAPRARSTSTVRYEFDELNRLVVTERDGADVRLRPTRIVEGLVTTDRANRLVYRVDSKAARDGFARRRVNLDGTWGLTRDHRLTLSLHQAERKRRQILYLNGAIVEAKAHALVVALHRHALDGRRTVQRLALSGRWQADQKNRLTFLVEKANGSHDPLTLQAGWHVGRHHELLYQYRQRAGATPRRAVHTLRFAGVWEITRAKHLVYRLDVSGESAFEFRASLQTPSLNARTGRLVYQVGIGLSGGRTRTEQVVLFGTWKLHRDLSISFEVPYVQGRQQAMRFTGTVAVGKRDAVSVGLLSRQGESLGISVTFRRRWLDDAELFLRLQKAGREAEALAGVQVRF